MDKELERWLSGRNLSKNTLKVLVKEELLTTEVISILREDDIRQLSTKHSLSVGETVHLREARDAVLRGEFPSASSGGVGAPGAEGDGAGAKDGSLKGDRASAPAAEVGSAGGHDSTQHHHTLPVESKGKQSHSEEPTKEVGVSDPVVRHGELQNRLREADQLQMQGDTEAANKRVNEVVEGAQGLVLDLRPPDITDLSGNIENIDGAIVAFSSSSQRSKFLCCSLL